MLRKALGHQLDIDPGEVDIALVKPSISEFATTIFLCDTLPNGSGYAEYLSNNLEQIVQSILDPKENGIGKGILSNNHVEKCDGICPQCLMEYSNRSFHGQLDWSLGVSWLRLLENEELAAITYQCGLQRRDFEFPEIQAYFDQAHKWKTKLIEWSRGRLEEFSGGMDAKVLKAGEAIPVLQHVDDPNHPDRKRSLIAIIHPFWDTEADHHPPGSVMRDLQDTAAALGMDIIYIDVFNLYRRAAWALPQLKLGEIPF